MIGIRPQSHSFRAIIEWDDPDTGERKQHSGEFYQISMGEAGRLMMTGIDGVSLNFRTFVSMQITHMEPVEPSPLTLWLNSKGG